MRRRTLFLLWGALTSCSLLVPLFGSERCASQEPTLLSCEVGEIAVLCQSELVHRHQCDIDEICLPFDTSKEVGNQPQNFDGCGVPISCGDGIVDPDKGEECDDANGVDTDACRSSCQINVCGDGVINFGDANGDGVSDESCEPPGVGSCSASCTLGCQSAADCENDPSILANLSCIDQVFCEDDPNDTVSGSVCRATLKEDAQPDVQGDCVASGCFPGVGPTSFLLPDGTACQVLTETGSCVLGVCRIEGHCGNGTIEAIEGELCDDGNQVNDDACDNNCLINCLVDVNNPLCGCGDGVLDPATEECDDANNINNDLCSNQCIAPRCGDGNFQPALEGCDDNNQLDGDGCSASCLLELCGDNQAIGGELCDGADLRGQDCVSLGFTTGVLSCQPGCQNFNTQGCQASAFCGDGSVSVGEQCDNGANNSDITPNACRTNCTLPRCGDSVIDFGEVCDDGNAINGDGCDNCSVVQPVSLCGDGIVGIGESCDDSNVINGDGCSSLCQIESAACANAPDFFVPSGNNFDTTVNFTNSVTGTCFGGGQEQIFQLRFSPPLVDGQTISVIVTPASGVDLGFYLRSVCDSPANEFFCQNAFGATQQESAAIPATLIPVGASRTDLFLVVDTVSTPGGYSLSVSRF